MKYINQIDNASNDVNFNGIRVRNAPIKNSISIVEGLPNTLKIYKISGSRYWQVRFFYKKKYTTKSLKTIGYEDAKKQARQFFSEFMDNLGQPQIKSKSMPFEYIQNQHQLFDFNEEIFSNELEKVKRNEITHGSYLMTRNRLEGLIFDFFRDKSLNQVTPKIIEDFVSFLTNKGLTSPTIKGYLAQLKKLLRKLVKNQLLNSIPEFPKISAKTKSRGGFTLTEYKAILKKSMQLRNFTFSNWNKENKIWIKRKYHVMPKEMMYLIQFMVYTFIRPGDLRQIKNQHIEIISGKRSYLRLNHPEIKRHKSATVSLPRAVPVYKNILEYQKSKGYGKPDDYVFFPDENNRIGLLNTVGWLFGWLLNELGFKKGPHGVDRSLYSLRHTAITFRLIYGGSIDLLTLARNARTSVEMIEKFYASTLDPEMNIDLLHGKRSIK